MNLHRVVVALSMSLFTAAAAAKGEVADEFRVFNDFQEVPDSELGAMRGRYVSRGRVIAFGVAMESVWKTSNNDAYSAGVLLEMRQSTSTYTPTVTFKPTFSVISSTDKIKAIYTGIAAKRSQIDSQITARKTGISGAGLDNFTGVTQGIQATGDVNTLRNNIVLDVAMSDAEPTEAALQDQVQSTISSVQSSGAVSGGNSLTPDIEPAGELPTTVIADAVGQTAFSTNGAVRVETENGVGLNVGLDLGGVTVQIGVPEEGQAVQQITNGMLGVGSGIRQNTEVFGHLNAIQNNLHLSAILSDIAVSRSVSFARMQQTLNGLRQLGSAF